MSKCNSHNMLLIVVIVLFFSVQTFGREHHDDAKLKKYRDRVVRMFQHAYDGYIQYAYPYDELRPLTCDGHDTWGSFSLTLIDALDTLAIMGNRTEFQRVVRLIIEHADFDKDVNVSVFETNIRVVGGLLSGHLLSHKMGVVVEPGWPCSGPLLNLAETVARKLLPAFRTATGMPYGTVNLRHGVPPGETTVTCTACIGTYILEFTALSYLTGDPIFEQTANAALQGLWQAKSDLDLVGNHIDVKTSKWTALDSSIGGGVDSYFEYLVKAAVMYKRTDLLEMFKVYQAAIEKHTKHDDWYLVAHMTKGGITMPIFQSLEAFWPGLQSLVGDVEKAMKTIHNYHQVWQQFGFTPEMYNIGKMTTHGQRESYPLRPELAESAMYLYRATGDPYLLEIGYDIVESIGDITATPCGFATVKNVNSHTLENRMESFFLSETTKYLYLLFTPDHFIHNTGNHGTKIKTPQGECVVDAGGYVFNTEAHPLDIGAVHCCSSQKKQERSVLQDLHDNLDLLTLFGIVDPIKDKFEGIPLKDGVDLRGTQQQMGGSKSDDFNSIVAGVTEELMMTTDKYVDTFADNTVANEDNNSENSDKDKKSEESQTDAEIVNAEIVKDLSSQDTATKFDDLFNKTMIFELLDAMKMSYVGRLNEKMKTSPYNEKASTLQMDVNNIYTKVLNVGSSEFSFAQKSSVHDSPSSKPDLLMCPALPYYMRFSVMGEMMEGNAE